MKAYSFDAAGNPSSDGATTFTWNFAGKLSTTVNNGKTHAQIQCPGSARQQEWSAEFEVYFLL